MEAGQKEAIISIIETNKIIESIRNEIENLCKREPNGDFKTENFNIEI